MYVAMSNKIRLKAAPPPPLFYVFDVFPAQRGALAMLGKRKKATKGSGLNLIKPNNYDYHVRFFL